MPLKRVEITSALAAMREREGLTQKQVADALGTTVQTVSNWENVREPRLNPGVMLKLCRILNCTLEELAGEES